MKALISAGSYNAQFVSRMVLFYSVLDRVKNAGKNINPFCSFVHVYVQKIQSMFYFACVYYIVLALYYFFSAQRSIIHWPGGM